MKFTLFMFIKHMNFLKLRVKEKKYKKETCLKEKNIGL